MCVCLSVKGVLCKVRHQCRALYEVTNAALRDDKIWKNQNANMQKHNSPWWGSDIIEPLSNAMVIDAVSAFPITFPNSLVIFYYSYYYHSFYFYVLCLKKQFIQKLSIILSMIISDKIMQNYLMWWYDLCTENSCCFMVWDFAHMLQPNGTVVRDDRVYKTVVLLKCSISLEKRKQVFFLNSTCSFIRQCTCK